MFKVATGLRLAVVVAGRADDRHVDELVRHQLGQDQVRSVAVIDMPDVDGPSTDPFRLREVLAQGLVDAAVVLAPPRWGARRLVPAPVVNGCAVAVLADARPGACGRQPTEAPWVVAAMAKDEFLRSTDHWAAALTAAGHDVVDLRADRARRSDLVAALRLGPDVVLYAGHGRTMGWSGYQALRLQHLEEDPPATPHPAAGLVVAFACDTLKRSRSRVPFGARLVERGHARAYLGAVGSVVTVDVTGLSEVVLDVLAEGTTPTVAHLMRAVDASVAGRPLARRAWRQFRLLGDPTTALR